MLSSSYNALVKNMVKVNQFTRQTACYHAHDARTDHIQNITCHIDTHTCHPTQVNMPHPGMLLLDLLIPKT